MRKSFADTRRALTQTLRDGRDDDAARLLEPFEADAAAATRSDNLAQVVSAAGMLSRLRRSAEAVAPAWPELTRVQELDRALAQRVVALQVAAARRRPVPIPPRIAAAAGDLPADALDGP